MQQGLKAAGLAREYHKEVHNLRTHFEISQTLQDRLDSLADSIASSADLVRQVMSQAESEGLELQQTRELLIIALKKRQLGDTTSRAHRPLAFKNANNVAEAGTA